MLSCKVKRQCRTSDKFTGYSFNKSGSVEVHLEELDYLKWKKWCAVLVANLKDMPMFVDEISRQAYNLLVHIDSWRSRSWFKIKSRIESGDWEGPMEKKHLFGSKVKQGACNISFWFSLSNFSLGPGPQYSFCKSAVTWFWKFNNTSILAYCIKNIAGKVQQSFHIFIATQLV